MKQAEMIQIPKQEYEKLKARAEIDVELMQQLVQSFKEIKDGKVRRVK